MANYSSVAVDPPSGATVAPRTGLDCGLWYVAQKGDTCAFITMTFSIGLSLFANTNPSINAQASGDCSASIVAGYAYCVSPVFSPYYHSINRTYTTKPFGCWSNLNTTSQPLTGPIWTGHDMTPDICAKACFTDGFTFTGLKGTDTCLCGDQVAMNSVQLSTSTCTADQGDAFSLYGLSDDVTITFQFRDVGCFSNSALVTGSAPSITWATNNTISDCSAFCLPAYPYFGLANGDTCRCGTGIDKASTPVDTDANCIVPCTGRASTNCGGSAATYIYAARGGFLTRPEQPPMSPLPRSSTTSSPAPASTSTAPKAGFKLKSFYHTDCTGNVNNQVAVLPSGDGVCIDTNCQVGSINTDAIGSCPDGQVQLSYWEQPGCIGKWFGYGYTSRGQCHGLWEDGWTFKSLHLRCANQKDDCVSKGTCTYEPTPTKGICR